MAQSDLGLPSTRQLEISHILVDRIIKQKHSPSQLPSQPRAPFPNDGADTKSTTAQRLEEILARIWASELGEVANLTQGPAVQAAKGSLADLSTASRDETSFHASIKTLAPSKQQAVAWVSYFLMGPNKLMRICSPTESQHLLDSLYNPEQTISQIEGCLITWQHVRVHHLRLGSCHSGPPCWALHLPSDAQWHPISRPTTPCEACSRPSSLPISPSVLP